MDRLLNVLAVFSVAMILAVLASVRRAHIRVEYSVSWLLAALALLGLSRWPAAAATGSGASWGPRTRRAGVADGHRGRCFWWCCFACRY